MKKLRKVLTLIVVFSMMSSYAYIPMVQAASLSAVSDTISTSAPTTLANHTVGFTTGVDLDAGGYVEVEVPATFGNVLVDNITCPATATTTKSVQSTEIARCTFTGVLASSTPYTFLVDAVTNPTAGIYDIEVRTYLSTDVLQESSIVKIAIIDTVTVTAHVDSTLTFAVAGVDAGQTVNGDTITATSTATTTPFGDILPGTQYVVGQQLGVTTNASAGFQVTVTQNDDFRTAAGAIIDSFVEGSATTTPTDWASPTGDLADITTWGHIGVATDDSDGLNGVVNYTNGFYTGLSVGTSSVIMAHDGPSSSGTADKGLSNIAYSVEIDALQEAGDYSTTLTYIATPTY
ncbi:MAG: hypothetical protein PF572_05005 [Patescibacteria group bacterium]|nr:hypothetical protein [Patescibacteria group bacterium]